MRILSILRKYMKKGEYFRRDTKGRFCGHTLENDPLVLSRWDKEGVPDFWKKKVLGGCDEK